ncbi:ABC transporter permease [Radicibacter daui]|uniref:ABC transporter permease n=1 Tax=Radicibacter daui TaxID=3064829 RepID=UPI0040470137
MDIDFAFETFMALVGAVPLTIQLAVSAIFLGAFVAFGLAMMRLSGILPLALLARFYVFVFRGTPLLVQIFLIYYGLGQFPAVRHSFLWPLLREPYACAVLSLMLNTAAYSSEIIRGGLLSVPPGQVEAARAVGMPRLMILRRVILPLAIRQALPAYGNEMMSMVKATSLASIITLMEVTGVAARIISETYRVIEVFVVAGAIYLALNFTLSRLVLWAERALSPDKRRPASAAVPIAAATPASTGDA